MLIPFKELFAKHNIQPTSILHIGAHWGEEADDYDRVAPRQVIWIEALPEAFRKLVQHVQHRRGHFPIQACIGDEDGAWVQFKVASNQGQSSSILDFGTHSKEHPDVRFVKTMPMRTQRVDTLLAGYKLSISPGSFLNIDLQGAEMLALVGMGDLLERFNFAYIEINDRELYKGCPLTVDIDGFLGNRGFSRVQTHMTNFGWGDALYKREG